MIARLWTTGIEAGRAEAYETFAREVSLPMFRAQHGFAGCVMGRAGDAAWVLTLWRDRAAIDALAVSPAYRETVTAILVAGVLAGEQTVTVSAAHLIDIPR